MHCGEKKDPKRCGVTGDDVAVESETAASGDAAGELEVDVSVVFPISASVNKPVDAPECGNGQNHQAREIRGSGTFYFSQVDF